MLAFLTVQTGDGHEKTAYGHIGYPNGSYYFEWEREWRKVGDFTFTTDEVAFSDNS
jgi:hypothetical protein